MNSTSFPSSNPQTRLRKPGWTALSITAVAGLGLLIPPSTLADTALVTGGSPAKILVPTDGSLGGTWRNRNFDDSAWLDGANGVGYEVNPGAFTATVIADSQGEFTTGGRQGENSWVNGWYDLTADLDGTYQAGDFQPFPRDFDDGTTRTEDNFWDGGSWNWFPDNVPWDAIGAAAMHPNGVNSGGIEHWAIRRWHSTASGDITIRFHLRKNNGNGNGTTGKIFQNGVELFSRAIAGSDQTGYEVYVNTTASEGDVFDFAHTPVGLDGGGADGSDSSTMIATILSGTITPPEEPEEPVGIADSQIDWGSAGQGENNWFYGYYNKTQDADGMYDPDSDFDNTDPNWNLNGSWQLGVDGDPAANPPWTSVGQTDWHPNGDNNGDEHWPIKRWVSDTDGELHARVQFRKSNTGGGNGTTLRVIQNGMEIFSHTVAFNDGVGIDSFIPLGEVFTGDKIEFALDPLGTDGLFGDGADGSFLIAQIFTGPAPVVSGVELANSEADWGSAAQGENNWYYGYYNKSQDSDGTYDANSDFDNTDPKWSFVNNIWQLGSETDPLANPPWSNIGQVTWHPNGDNNVDIQFPIRRWVSTADGDMHAHIHFGAQNLNGGAGTTLHVYHNSTEMYKVTVGGRDGVGVMADINLTNVFVGDKIDFALSPENLDGTFHDGSDGSFLRASILTGLVEEPPPPFVPGVGDCFVTDIENEMKGVNGSVFIRIPFDVADPAAIDSLKLKMKYNDGIAAYINGQEVIKRNAPTAISGIVFADSIADWSTDPSTTVNGWEYGYYDETADTDGSYAKPDFMAFPYDGGPHSATSFWTGSGWDWFEGNPPWTELFQENSHPNDINTGPKHWAIRRWNANVDGNLKCRVRFRKTNVNCGDGVRVSVFHNSVRVYSETIAANDGVGRDDTIDLIDVFAGDTVDIMLGPGDGGNDGCDGSAFSAVIFEGEPSVPWDGLATDTRTPTQTITPEVFDISSAIGALTAGNNVLAIQGLNAGIDDNEFVVNAQLLANQAPTAVDDVVGAAQDMAVSIPGSLLSANDVDADGDALILVGVTPGYTTSQGGSVHVYGSDVLYTPPAGFFGTDSFEYTVTDKSGVPATATVTVNVEMGTNQTPVANDDQATTDEDVAVSIDVLANDTDADGDPLTVSLAENANNGSASVNPDGTVTYSPALNFNGSDSFTYVVNDGTIDSAPATVVITILPVNDPPTCSPGAASIDEDVSAPITLSGGDVDGDALQYVVVDQPLNGSVSISGNVATYQGAANFCGSDTFTFKTVDPSGAESGACAVEVTVNAVNDAPVGVIMVPDSVDLGESVSGIILIASDGVAACATLDGSASSDPDAGTNCGAEEITSYTWVDANDSVLGMGPLAEVCLPVGVHTVTLIADDGADAGSASVVVEVLTAGEAVEELVNQVEDSVIERDNKRPFLATLKNAIAAFDRGNNESALNRLSSAFQNKVRAQIAKDNPEVAEEWIRIAQEIIDAFAEETP